MIEATKAAGADCGKPELLQQVTRCKVGDLDFVELYGCFPIAVESYAWELNRPTDIAWSFTGAMPFAGGPFNDFVLHAVAQLAKHIRNKTRSRGMVTTVSGILTKQGFGIWGADPNDAGYQFIDVTDDVIANTDHRQVDSEYTGSATVAGYTILHPRDGSKRGVAVVDLPTGKRSIGSTTNSDLVAAMEKTDFIDTHVNLHGAELSVAADR